MHSCIHTPCISAVVTVLLKLWRNSMIDLVTVRTLEA